MGRDYKCVLQLVSRLIVTINKAMWFVYAFDDKIRLFIAIFDVNNDQIWEKQRFVYNNLNWINKPIIIKIIAACYFHIDFVINTI